MSGRKEETTDIYCEDTLEKVETLVKDIQLAEAYAVLDKGLFMPCAPREYEEPLIAYYNQCRSKRRWKGTAVREEDIETLLEGFLRGAFLTVEQLKKSNIRNHMDAVADYLPQNLHYLACFLMIGAMMEQNITDKVSVGIDDPEVTSSLCNLNASIEGEGALETANCLKGWLGNNNLTFTMMCVETLVKGAYLCLSFNTEEDETLPLVAIATVYVFHVYEEHEAWIFLEEEKSLAQYRGYKLLLRKHEM